MPIKIGLITAQRTSDQNAKAERRNFNQRLHLAKKDERIRRLREDNSKLRRAIKARNEAIPTLSDENERLRAEAPDGIEPTDGARH